LSEDSTTVIRSAGLVVDSLEYGAGLPTQLTDGNYDTLVLSRYAYRWEVMTPELIEALDVFTTGGGNIVTEWDGASIFMSEYDASYRYAALAPTQLGLFDGAIGRGGRRGSGTPITLVEPGDPLFTDVTNPFSAGSGTDFFFTITGVPQLRNVATFAGGSGDFTAATYGTIFRGLHCGGNVIFTTFDWNDEPTEPGFGSLIGNLVRESFLPAPAGLTDTCPL
jgi:hypothetical protein